MVSDGDGWRPLPREVRPSARAAAPDGRPARSRSRGSPGERVCGPQRWRQRLGVRAVEALSDVEAAGIQLAKLS